MAQTSDLVVNLKVDTTKWDRAMDKIVRPLGWREAVVVWVARRLDVHVEFKRRFRLKPPKGGFI